MPIEFPSSPITGTTFTTTSTWTWNGSTWNAAAVPAGLVTTVDTQTLVNKTISGTANTITLAAASVGTAALADGSVTTAKIADGAVSAAKLSSSTITINGSPVSLGGSVTISGLPSQTGNSGKYLSTDGSTASWALLDTGPDYNSLFLFMGV